MEHEAEIAELLKELGMPATLCGYEYLKVAIEIGMQGTIYGSVTKKVYPYIAERFGTTSQRVERCIRNAIEKLWDRGNIKMLHKLFRYSIHPMKGKPTNMEFIAVLSEYMRLKSSCMEYIA